MASSLLGLAPGGGYLATCITADAGGLLHHLFTITPRKRGAVCFCGPYPAGSLLTEASPPRVLSDAVLYGVRTFLDLVNTRPRSPNRPEAKIIIHGSGWCVNGTMDFSLKTFINTMVTLRIDSFENELILFGEF